MVKKLQYPLGFLAIAAILILIINLRGEEIAKQSRPYATVLLGSTPLDMRPEKITGYHQETLLSQICGRLLYVNDALQFGGDLASKWKVDRTNKTISFEINEDIRFSTGEEVTVDDVIYSIEKLSSQESLRSDYFVQNIEKVLSKNSLNVTVEYRNTPEETLYILAADYSCIVNRNNPYIVVAGDVYIPNTFGHYVIQEKLNNDSFRLVKNPNDRRSVLEETIDVYFRTEDEAIELFLQNKVDDLSFLLLTSNQIQAIKSSKKDTRFIASEIYWTWLVSPNNRKDWLAEPSKRRSVLSFFASIRDSIPFGPNLTRTKTMLPHGTRNSAVGSISTDSFEEDPMICTKGQSISGAIIDGTPNAEKVSHSIQRLLRDKAKCDANVRILEMKEFMLAMEEGTFDFYISAWDLSSTDPISIYRYAAERSLSRHRYPEFAEIYKEIKTKRQNLRTKEDLDLLNRAFFDNGIAYPFGTMSFQFAVQPNVKTIHISPLGMAWNRWHRNMREKL